MTWKHFPCYCPFLTHLALVLHICVIDLVSTRSDKSMLFGVMGWRRPGANPLPKPTLTCCEFCPYQQTLMKFQPNDKSLINKIPFLNVVWVIISIFARGTVDLAHKQPLSRICFSCTGEQMVQQTVQLPVITHPITPILPHSNIWQTHKRHNFLKLSAMMII